MLHLALSLDAQLAIVAISTLEEANALDLLEREGGDGLFLVAYETKTANPTAISERDMFAINRELPASGFVLDTSIVVLELRIAFLPQLLFFAVSVEAGNSEPRSISTGLTSLGIERGGKRVFFGEHGTIHLKVMLAGVFIHPFAHALVADELNDANRLIDSGRLGCVKSHFILVDQHCLLPFPPCSGRLNIHQ